MFFNIYSNVQHKSTCAGQSLPHCFLRQCALQNSDCAAPSGSTVGHASSGQFLCSLLSHHSAQLLHAAVVDVALRSRMLHFLVNI